MLGRNVALKSLCAFTSILRETTSTDCGQESFVRKEALAGQRKTLKPSQTFIYNGLISHSLTALTLDFGGRNLSPGLGMCGIEEGFSPLLA